MWREARRLGFCIDYRWSVVQAAAVRAEGVVAFHKRLEGVDVEGLVGRSIGSSVVCQLTVEGKNIWAVRTGRRSEPHVDGWINGRPWSALPSVAAANGLTLSPIYSSHPEL